MDINSVIKAKEYDFLRNDPFLGDNIVFLTFGGSHAYGTNIETSDVDVRGCTLNTVGDLLGTGNFEQVIHTTTDTTVYAFKKLVSLLTNCNPNVIEMLGCLPEHYTMMSDVGKALIEKRRMFLSTSACRSFGGYATQQLRRLQNALARDKYTSADKNAHIAQTLDSVIYAMNSRYADFNGGSIKVAGKDDGVYVDMRLENYPLKDLAGMLSELSGIAQDYDKLRGRNNKKDDAHLNKHAMHLIRLHMMCIDILEKEEIVTYRRDDLPLLMKIRNGEFQNADGTYRSEFFDLVGEYDKRMLYAAANTSLPRAPKLKDIEEFVISVNYETVKKRMEKNAND